MTMESPTTGSEATPTVNEGAPTSPEQTQTTAPAPSAEIARIDQALSSLDSDKTQTLSRMNEIYRDLGVDTEAVVPERITQDEAKLQKEKEGIKEEYTDYEIVSDNEELKTTPEQLQQVEEKMQTFFTQMKFVSAEEIQYFYAHGEAQPGGILALIIKLLFGTNMVAVAKFIEFYQAHTTITDYTELAREFAVEQPELLSTFSPAVEAQEALTKEIPGQTGEQRSIGGPSATNENESSTSDSGRMAA